MKQFFFIAFLLNFCSTLQAQIDPLLSHDALAQKKWVDSVYNQLSLKQKVGQLFMVDVFSVRGKSEQKRIEKLIENQEIGGVIFSKGGPVRQAKMHNALQAKSKIPLLVSMDAEWGLSMRLDSTYAFPWNMTLGAIKDTLLVKKTGAAIAKHCKRLGVHINFAPVIDINTNPINPIIGNRSFGETKELVANHGTALMQGMHSQNVLTSGKHFPGHGDTSKDSHKTLPTITFSKNRILETELYPFQKLINSGISSIMIAHLNIPSLVEKEGLPSSLSKNVVTNLLQEQLKFKGLIFTDALNMKGASNFKEPGAIDLAAFEAGNDILLISEDIPKSVKKLVANIKSGNISEERLKHSVIKILKAKYKVGLHHYKPVETNNLIADLNSLENDVLYEQLAENAITVVKNDLNFIPVKDLELKNIAYVHFGEASGDAFHEQLKLYTKVDRVAVNTPEDIDKLKNYNQVIIGFHASNASPWKPYKIKAADKKLIDTIAQKHNSLLACFAKPYALNNLEAGLYLNSIVVGYQNSKIFQEKAAQIIFGGLPAKGKLPVSISPNNKVGDGFFLNNNHRLSYGLPESVGVNSYKLAKIDSIVNIALAEEMTPGLQLLVSRKGKVIHHKSYGFQTYKKENPITSSSIYDLASLTKILATLPLFMKLEQSGVVNIEEKLSELLPALKDTNKDAIKVVEALSHFGKLKPWIPFYIRTLDTLSLKPSKNYYKKQPDSIFSIKVADEFYLRKDYKDSIYSEVVASELRKKQEYKYSDLPYYFIQKYIETFYGTNLGELSANQFYKPLGANYTGYQPLKNFSKNEIVPTEVDSIFRGQEIRGYVHDQGAAMLGGEGGHAGLFSNANDVAKIMQLYLNKGSYGGHEYLYPSTIDKFNTCYYCEQDNRRGVGFDKPQLKEVGPTCGCISMTSFGHSGFTGTYTWADPEEEIIYVFLSNRTYPDATNRKLIKEDIRTKIQGLIYKAIEH